MSELDYIAVLPCGCARAWVSITVDRKRVAELLADWILAGYSIEQASTEDAKLRLRRCERCRPGRQIGLDVG